jgi:hypothetical protein
MRQPYHIDRARSRRNATQRDHHVGSRKQRHGREQRATVGDRFHHCRRARRARRDQLIGN